MTSFNEGFQQEIAESKLRAICTNVFPENPTISNIEFIKAGRFNTTYAITLIGRAPIIIRIAPAPDMPIYALEYNLMRREYAVEPYLNRISTLRPQIIYSDFSHRIIDRDYLVLSRLEGISGDSVDLSKLPSHVQIHIWKQIIDLSYQIQTATSPKFGLPYNEGSFPTWSQSLEFILTGMISDIKKYNLPGNLPQSFKEVLSTHKSVLDEVAIARLAHGDLWPKNMMFKNELGDISGVLDCERAFWGDPFAEWILPGELFGNEKAKSGYTFRCGFFSENFTQIPQAVVQLVSPKTQSARIRNSIYLGIYLTQRILESQRFPRNEPWVFEAFERVLSDLRS